MALQPDKALEKANAYAERMKARGPKWAKYDDDKDKLYFTYPVSVSVPVSAARFSDVFSDVFRWFSDVFLTF